MPANRFRRDIEALTGHALRADEKLLVAVSGGPDSLALLLLAHAAYGSRVHAATVDHAMRAANADEARFVADLCASRAIAHATLTRSNGIVVHAASLQAQARGLRYLLLADHAARLGCRWLATGHHRDDQAETLLMRMARGSGLPGLAAIRPRRREHSGSSPASPVEIIRPLLGWTRASLREIVDEAGLVPIDDPSNRSPDHDRTHFRALLARTPLLKPDRLAASASHLGNCEDALAWAEEREWDARHNVAHDQTWQVDVIGLPRELRRRLTLRAIEAVRSEHGMVAEWRRDGVGRLLELLGSGRAATLAGVKCSGGVRWRFEAAPPRRAGRQR